MTHEDMERSIEFILQQQAKAEERQGKFEASVQQSIEFILKQQAKAASDTMQLSAFGGELAKGQLRMQNALSELGESHKQLAESHRQLAEAQKRTEEKLSAFISALDRRFGGDGKGRE